MKSTLFNSHSSLQNQKFEKTTSIHLRLVGKKWLLVHFFCSSTVAFKTPSSSCRYKSVCAGFWKEERGRGGWWGGGGLPLTAIWSARTEKELPTGKQHFSRPQQSKTNWRSVEAVSVRSAIRATRTSLELGREQTKSENARTGLNHVLFIQERESREHIIAPIKLISRALAVGGHMHVDRSRRRVTGRLPPTY